MNNLMGRAVNRHGMGVQLAATAVCQAANQLSQGRWQAISFRQGRLKLAVPDYDAVASLRLQEAHLKGELNSLLGTDAIKQIGYTVRPLQTRADLIP